jgi:DNA-binding XRE family transcriptional regulator
MGRNRVREIRGILLLSKAKLARKAGISPLTLDRVERGICCRIETKRKIILALGYKVNDVDKVFPKGS